MRHALRTHTQRPCSKGKGRGNGQASNPCLSILTVHFCLLFEYVYIWCIWSTDTIIMKTKHLILRAFKPEISQKHIARGSQRSVRTCRTKARDLRGIDVGIPLDSFRSYLARLYRCPTTAIWLGQLQRSDALRRSQGSPLPSPSPHPHCPQPQPERPSTLTNCSGNRPTENSKLASDIKEPFRHGMAVLQTWHMRSNLPAAFQLLTHPHIKTWPLIKENVLAFRRALQDVFTVCRSAVAATSELGLPPVRPKNAEPSVKKRGPSAALRRHVSLSQGGHRSQWQIPRFCSWKV